MARGSSASVSSIVRTAALAHIAGSSLSALRVKERGSQSQRGRQKPRHRFWRTVPASADRKQVQASWIGVGVGDRQDGAQASTGEAWVPTSRVGEASLCPNIDLDGEPASSSGLTGVVGVGVSAGALTRTPPSAYPHRLRAHPRLVRPCGCAYVRRPATSSLLSRLLALAIHPSSPFPSHRSMLVASHVVSH